MPKFKKCTDKDIFKLLDSSTDTEEDDDVSKKSIHSSSSSKTLNDKKGHLLQSDPLQKERVSLRLKLRRSTEQSVYKIDTSPEYEESKKIIKSTKNRLKKLQDENRVPRTSPRMIKVPTRFSDYSSPITSLRREQINYDEESSPASIKTDKRKETRKHDFDSDSVCASPYQSRRSNIISKNNKRNRIAPMEDINSDNATLPKIIRTKSSKRMSVHEESKADNMNKIPLNEKIISDSDTNAKHHAASFDSTPRRKSKIKKNSKSLLLRSDKCKPTTQKDKNTSKVDQLSFICEGTKDLSINKTPRKMKKSTKEVKNVDDLLDTPKSRASLKYSALTPSVKIRTKVLSKPVTPLQEARSRLHVSAVPKSLPCREEEFNNIYTFLEGKLIDNTGGCIYISGVPGTGKSATVNEVIKCLKRSVSKGKLEYFDFVEINGMKLSEPRQAYVHILKQLSGKVLTWEQAYNALEKRFKSSTKSPMTLLLADELDLLCTKRQDVIYNLLDWPTKISAQLVVITIANTMDLPERVLMSRVTSRLGLTRVTFQPYNHKQLQEIVITRLKDIDIFKSEAIQLIARKVSAVSGDARRALDICRRAAEITEIRNSDIVSIQDVNQALSEMIATPKIQAIKHCSKMEQIFLQAVCTEVTRIGVEEVCFANVYKQLESLCSFDGIKTPNITETLAICARLGTSRLLICEHSRNDIHQRILLNVSTDDIHYALQQVNLD